MLLVMATGTGKTFQVFMSLYHQLAGEEGEEPFRQFRPEFFDLIIVDECHRGSAKADSEWRRILNYFHCAIHIGLTATPKETVDVSNKTYFGEPIYTYSLKQGILDGFLAPYKVIRVNIDKDLSGWRPQVGQKDTDGKNLPDKMFYQEDYDTNLFIEERTKLVANRITTWLKENGRLNKTIVFCKNTEHAELMRRALAVENNDIMRDNPNYVMKITGDDEEGKRQLDNFIEPNATPPIIATTAELLSTGVDCKTVKLIVIDKVIESMIMFKQIIGRGTRLFPNYDKNFFTIIDFSGATEKFYDPEFDGDPGIILCNTEIRLDKKVESIDNSQEKYHVRGVEVAIVNEAVSFLGKDGKLITENSKTKPMLFEHFADCVEWWSNRQEIQDTDSETFKAKSFTVAEIVNRGYDLDLCGYPSTDEEILSPIDTIKDFQERRAALNSKIDSQLEKLSALLQNIRGDEI